MKDKFLFISFCLSVFIYLLFSTNCLLPAVSYAVDVDAVVNRIQKQYDEIHDMQGSFIQISHIKDLDRTEEYSGSFSIKKPSMFRWKYAPPRDEEVIIGGADIWIYKRSEKQVLKSRFDKSAYSQVPIAMLESLGEMKTDYEITMTKKGVLELVPRKEMGFVRKIHIETGQGDFPINMLTIFDMYSNTIILKLKDVKVNPGLDNSFFVFKIPQGVEVYDLSR